MLLKNRIIKTSDINLVDNKRCIEDDDDAVKVPRSHFKTVLQTYEADALF